MYKKNEALMDRVRRHEGWMSKPYPDKIHGWKVPTFGYGFTYLTEDEGDAILRNRIQMISSLLRRKIPFFKGLNHLIQGVLVEMAYQMGVPGLLAFKQTLRFIGAGEYRKAANEMLDSKWAKQTPTRARELAEIVRNYEKMY